MTPYSATGKLLLDDESGQPQWQATLFAAALDAKQGRRWPSEQRWWDQVDDGAARWARSWQSRGAAILAVLLALPCSATLGDRMGAAGAVSDLWGPPRPRLVARWEQVGESWIVAPGGASETRERGAAGTPRGRSPPTTKTPPSSAPGSATVCP